MTVAHDIMGQRFGLLTAVECEGNGWWVCECQCGTRKRYRAVTLVATQRMGWSSSCGCRKRGGAPKYATVFRGDMRSIGEIRRMVGVSENTSYRWVRDGIFNEAGIEAWLAERDRRKALTSKAKELGLSPDTVYQRKARGMAPEAAYTTPLNSMKSAAGRGIGQ